MALLRGINVGGKCKLPMRELAPLFTQAGAAEVRTYIQSGNVVFAAATYDEARAIAAEVTAAIVEKYGYSGRIVLRSAEEFAAAVEANPFLSGPEPHEEKALHVYFLADAPDPAVVASLDGDAFAPDRFRIVGREIFVSLPNGAADTKLTNGYFDSRLKTTSTARNWRTVQTLMRMLQE